MNEKKNLLPSSTISLRHIFCVSCLSFTMSEDIVTLPHTLYYLMNIRLVRISSRKFHIYPFHLLYHLQMLALIIFQVFLLRLQKILSHYSVHYIYDLSFIRVSSLSSTISEDTITCPRLLYL